jgi:hypothetical protein
MTTEQVQGTFLSMLKDYGFATVVALACLYVGRQDVLLPLVKAHTQFLEKLAQTQIEIASAVQEQTRLLYALQPERRGEPAYKVSAPIREENP